MRAKLPYTSRPIAISVNAPGTASIRQPSSWKPSGRSGAIQADAAVRIEASSSVAPSGVPGCHVPPAVWYRWTESATTWIVRAIPIIAQEAPGRQRLRAKTVIRMPGDHQVGERVAEADEHRAVVARGFEDARDHDRGAERRQRQHPERGVDEQRVVEARGACPHEQRQARRAQAGRTSIQKTSAAGGCAEFGPGPTSSQ